MSHVSKLNKIDLVVISLCFILAAVFFVTHRDFTAQNHKTLVFSSTETVVKAVPQARSTVLEIAAPLPAPQIVALPIIPPKIVFSILPEYPASALESGIQGVTTLQVYVEPSGRVADVNVSQSSGSTLLDQVAKTSVKTWIFQAASQGGAAIASCLQIPVRFSLKD
ncbi:MAG: energy transducer TonB [Candidatus Saganbacteria bacterium]|nr:energy transducer TonB [Candidatus Saganbacteria bacterium]